MCLERRKEPYTQQVGLTHEVCSTAREVTDTQTDTETHRTTTVTLRHMRRGLI
jgi:hypothetical protein